MLVRLQREYVIEDLLGAGGVRENDGNGDGVRRADIAHGDVGNESLGTSDDVTCRGDVHLIGRAEIRRHRGSGDQRDCRSESELLDHGHFSF
jgi:hypothetical protein